MLFQIATAKHQLPDNLLSSICYIESKHLVDAIHTDDGNSDSLGICQLKLDTAQWLGFEGDEDDLMKPFNNVEYAARYLSYQLNRYNDISRAIVAYNRGNAKGLTTSSYSDKVFKEWRNQNMTIATCHSNRKMQARGLYKNCYDKGLKSYNVDYKNNQISNTTKWARNNPEKMQMVYNRRREKDKADPNYRLKQRNRLLKKYGLTNGSYNQLLASQGNKCTICTRNPGLTTFHVDHCHSTNKVRGILCHQCNWYLGLVDADPEILNQIKFY